MFGCVRSYCSCWVDLSVWGPAETKQITTQLCSKHFWTPTITRQYKHELLHNRHQIYGNLVTGEQIHKYRRVSILCSRRYTEVVFLQATSISPQQSNKLSFQWVVIPGEQCEHSAGNSSTMDRVETQVDVPATVWCPRVGVSAVFVTQFETWDLTWKPLIFYTVGVSSVLRSHSCPDVGLTYQHNVFIWTPNLYKWS